MKSNTKRKGYPESVGKFSLENYRVFETETEFDFKPITFLVGPNSSGKSSLMKLLKAFSANTLNSSHYSFAPSFINSNLTNQNTEPVNLKNSFTSNDKPFSFKIESAGIFGALDVNYSLNYENSSKARNGINLSLFELKRKNELIISISPQKNADFIIRFSIREFISLCKDFLSVDFDSDENNETPAFYIKTAPKIENCDKIFNLKDHLLNDIYLSKLNELENITFNSKKNLIEIDTSKHPQEAHVYLSRQLLFDDFGDNGLKGFFQFLILGGFQQIFQSELEKMGFDGDVDLTRFGEFLLNDFSNKIQYDLTYTIGKNIDFAHTPVFKREREMVFNINDISLTTFDLLLKAYILDHLSWFENGILLSNDYIDEWLVKFGIGKTLIVRKMEFTDQYFIIEIEKENGQNINISDLGYGAGQVLAYLFLPYYSKIPSCHIIESYNIKESIVEKIDQSGIRKVEFNSMKDISGKMIIQNVYLEEPETNLHPNWQSILAELIVYQISIGIRFVIETHSEYLIRKIQNLIALKNCDKNDVVIYYFNSEKERKHNNKTTSFKITLNENGTLSESFGAGFFDEAGKLSLELLSINSTRKN